MWPTFLDLYKHVLESFSFTTARVASLHTMLDRYVKYISNTHVRPPLRSPPPLLHWTGQGSTLSLPYSCSLQFESCLSQSGLAPVLQAIHEKDPDVRPPTVIPLIFTAES